MNFSVKFKYMTCKGEKEIAATSVSYLHTWSNSSVINKMIILVSIDHSITLTTLTFNLKAFEHL